MTAFAFNASVDLPAFYFSVLLPAISGYYSGNPCNFLVFALTQALKIIVYLIITFPKNIIARRGENIKAYNLNDPCDRVLLTRRT